MKIRLAALVAAPVLGLILAGPVDAARTAPVADDVRSALDASGTTRVWVQLGARADLRGAADLPSKVEKGRFVYVALTQVAQRTQAPLLAHLDAAGVRYRSLWVTNAIVVDVDRALLDWLAARPEVSRISANKRMRLLSDVPADERLEPEASSTVEWNVTEVGAPEAWDLGYTGQGVVVASADTGVDWDHPGLVNAYRGKTSGRVSHDYSWFDGIDGAIEPYDDNGHGTFTTGQMVGEDGANQVGVAPDAQWIGCKNMDNTGFGTPESYTACFQFFIAPTDTRGRNPDPALAPDVVNNSWGCPTVEGCDGDTLLEIVDAVQAAGIMLVVSAGNSGPGCTSVEDPPGTYDSVFTVGAYDSSGNLAGFSSRGPSSFDRSVKPNIAAPGVSVRSTATGGGYTSGWSGTSMAAPEVAAAAALVWSANPALVGDIEGTRTLLEDTSHATRGPRCGGDRATGENNMWGFGKLDVGEAVRQAARMR